MSMLLASFFGSWLGLGSISETPRFAVDQLNEKGIEAKLSDRGIVFFVPGFLFDSGSASVTDAVADDIKLIIQVLELNGIDDDLVYFEGHTDKSGDPELNLMLGQLRAEAVQKQFHTNGLSPQRTLVYSYGDTLPISDNPEENRRVEIVVVDINQ